MGYAPGLCRSHFTINTSRLFHYGNQLNLLDQPTKLSKKKIRKNKFLSDAGLLNLKKWSKEQMSHNLSKNIKYWNAESM